MSEVTIGNPVEEIVNDDYAIERMYPFIISEIHPAETKYRAQDRAIDTAIQENFRTSFKLSTGSAFLQALIQARIIDVLQLKHDSQSIKDTVASMTFDTESFAIPKLHQQETATNTRAPYMERAQDIWDVYMDICLNRHSLEHVSPTVEFEQSLVDYLADAGQPDVIGFTIAYEMIGRELTYLEQGRPGRTSDVSKYRSLIHDCAFHQKPTGTPEGDVIMAELAAVIRSLFQSGLDIPKEDDLFLKIKEDFGKLVRGWEWRHERSFFSDDRPPIFTR